MRPSLPTHTIIIGAGVIGVSAAYELARRGHRATVLDKGSVACGASFGNAGIIAVGHAPLPRPGLAWNAIKWMLKRTSPLHIHPRLDPSLIAWLWRFWRSCSDAHVASLMPSLSELGWISMERFQQLVETEQLDCDFAHDGWMEVFGSEMQLREMQHTAEGLRQFGIGHEILLGPELRTRDPIFKDNVHGAVMLTDSAYADPEKYVTQLAQRATKLGAEIRSNAAVKDVHFTSDRFTGVTLATGERIEGDVVVLAAGAWTTELGKQIGVRVPMQAAKGYHVDLGGVEVVPSTTCVLAETFVAVTPLSRGLRLAGTLEMSGINHRIDRQRVDMLRKGAARFLHGLDESAPLEERSVWCGLRPCTADGMPVIGWAPGRSGVFIATGHAMMGFTLGPGTGVVIAEEILEGQPPRNSSSMRGGGERMNLRPMSPARFA